MKAYISLYSLTLYFTKDFSSNGDFIYCLDGVCKCIMYYCRYYRLLLLLGLPIPIVATAAGISTEHYGSEHR